MSDRPGRADGGRPLIVCVSGFADGLGGAQTAYRELVSVLASEGHRVIAISLTDEWRDARLIGAEQEWCVPHRSTPLALPAKVFALARAITSLRRLAPDVYVSVGMGGVANSIARSLRPKTFTICQDFIYGRGKDDMALRRTEKRFDALAPQAPAIEAHLRTLDLKIPIRWLPCFPAVVHEEVVAKAPTAAPYKLAYFGRVETNKGLSNLVRALAMTAVIQSVSLDIWGTGRTSDLEREVEALGLGSCVQLLGRYPSGREGAVLMASYDALVLPTSGNEGLPLILLEAMAYGLPILATNVAAVSDCCGQNADAVMVEPSVQSLSEGVAELVRRLDNREMSPSRQRALYQERFSRDVFLERWSLCLRDPRAFFEAVGS